jgi:hypothetical protein
MEADNSIQTFRIFAANGIFYQIQLLGSPLPVEERGQLESTFSMFEFMDTPTAPAAAASTPSGSSNAPGTHFSYTIGKITGLLLLIALGIVAVRRVLVRR